MPIFTIVKHHKYMALSLLQDGTSAIITTEVTPNTIADYYELYQALGDVLSEACPGLTHQVPDEEANYELGHEVMAILDNRRKRRQEVA